MERNRDKDMLALEKAFFKNLQVGDAEYGGIGLDDKRPFGNSNVTWDILGIIGHAYDDEENGYSDEAEAYADGLYDALIPHLQNKYL